MPQQPPMMPEGMPEMPPEGMPPEMPEMEGEMPEGNEPLMLSEAQLSEAGLDSLQEGDSFTQKTAVKGLKSFSQLTCDGNAALST